MTYLEIESVADLPSGGAAWFSSDLTLRQATDI